MIFDLKLLTYAKIYSIRPIFCVYLSMEQLWFCLANRWGFFNVYLRPLEAIEIIEVSMCANQSILLQVSPLYRIYNFSTSRRVIMTNFVTYQKGTENGLSFEVKKQLGNLKPRFYYW